MTEEQEVLLELHSQHDKLSKESNESLIAIVEDIRDRLGRWGVGVEWGRLSAACKKVDPSSIDGGPFSAINVSFRPHMHYRYWY